MDIDLEIKNMKKKIKGLDTDFNSLEKQYYEKEQKYNEIDRKVRDIRCKLYEKCKELCQRYNLDITKIAYNYIQKFASLLNVSSISRQKNFSYSAIMPFVESMIYESPSTNKIARKTESGKAGKSLNHLDEQISNPQDDKMEDTVGPEFGYGFFKELIPELQERLSNDDRTRIDNLYKEYCELIEQRDAIGEKIDEMRSNGKEMDKDLEICNRELETLMTRQEKMLKLQKKEQKVVVNLDYYKTNLSKFIIGADNASAKLRNKLVEHCKEWVLKTKQDINRYEIELTELELKLERYKILDDLSQAYRRLNESVRLRELFGIKDRLIEGSTESVLSVRKGLVRYASGNNDKLIDGLKRMGIKKESSDVDTFMENLNKVADTESFSTEYKQLLKNKDELLEKWQKAQEKPELLNMFLSYYKSNE